MSKLFLILCTILAWAISVTGLATVRHPQDVTLHLVFLPVTAFLTISSVREILHFRSPPEVSLGHRWFQLTILAAIFIALLSLGWRSLNQQPPASQASSPMVLTRSDLPTPTPQIPLLTITHPDPTAQINIRTQPATTSSLLLKASVGTTYPLEASDSGWFRISLPDGSSGWVHSDYATTSAVQP